MAQDQKQVNSQDVENKSFDQILERMRSRVSSSEIADEGRVRKILNEETFDNETAEPESKAMSGNEQDRAFVEMSKQIAADGVAPSEPSRELDASVEGQEPEQSGYATEEERFIGDNAINTLTVEEGLKDEEDDSETYNQILEALGRKDLSSIESSDPSALDQIVAGTEAEASQAPIDENAVIEMGPPATNTDEAKFSEMPSEALESDASIVPTQNEKTVLESTVISETSEANAADENVATPAKKVDYTRAFDRLTQVATSMSHSLAQKTEEVSSEASMVESKDDVKAVEESIVDPENEKVNSGVGMDAASLKSASKDRAEEHNERLDQIEKTLKDLASSHEDMEKRSLDFAQKQEESLRVMGEESQKSAEATATKLFDKLSAKVEAKAAEEHTILRADMETVQSGLAGLSEKFEGASRKQDDAYEMMRSSLAALHEKMSSFNVDEGQMRAAQVAGTRAKEKNEQSLTQRIEKELIVNEREPEPEQVAPAPRVKVQAQRQEQERSVSSHALNSFIHAPLVRHSNQEEEAVSGLFNKVNNDLATGGQAGDIPVRHVSAPSMVGGSSQEGETVIIEKQQKSSKAPVILAVSSMFMFSVSGYLFYDHLKQQGFNTELASIERPSDLPAPPTTASLVGEKKIVEWRYNGKKKENIAQLASDNKAIAKRQSSGYVDVASNTEIVEVGGARETAPLTTSSLGSGSKMLDIKRKKGTFEKPSVLIGSTSLRAAAGKGVTSAMFEVARRFQNGKGVKKSYKEAARWYRRAADKNYAPAQYRLGTLYERGRGVEQNIESARDWYRRSARLGNVKAMHNLGVIFSGQKEMRPDYALAIEWFTKAAKYGLADSQFNLAIINYNGLGKAKDVTEAYKWFSLAAKNGDKAAKEQQDNIVKKMKIKQIMDGRKKASAWKNSAIPAVSNIDLKKRYSWQDYAEL